MTAHALAHDRPGPRAYEPMRHRPTPGRWSRTAILDALRTWERETGSAPRRMDWAGEHPEGAGDAQRKWMREHPRWPSSSCVAAHFGRWSVALAAAGIAGGAPRPRAATVGERVAAARRLAAEGCSAATIAARLGVSVTSAYNYLAATDCPGCGGPVTRPGAASCAACLRHEPTVARTWDREGVRTALREWRRVTGVAPSYRDWTPATARSGRWVYESPRWPSAAAVCRLYAEDPQPWTAALHDAGLVPRGERRRARARLAAAV